MLECIDAVDAAFRCHSEGRTLGPGVRGVSAPEEDFTFKAAALVGARRVFLACADARTVTLVGCDVQGEMQLAALTAVRPFERVWLIDTRCRARTRRRAGRSVWTTTRHGAACRRS